MDSAIQIDLPLGNLPETTEKLYIAFSGGIDSSVLLHALLKYKKQYRLVLWHINHGLQQNAQSMEDFARSQADLYGLEFCLNKLKMKPEEGNQEARAREHRYSLFQQVLSKQDVLLTAHHKNDQAETLLLNLMRGSGSTGLRAIASLKSLGKGFLFRPLINFSRDQIEIYASQHQLTWVEDPSNKKTEFDRNYLRHNVLPVIINRWPSAINQLHRVSELQVESEQLQTDLAKIDYTLAKVNKDFTKNSCLSVNILFSLSSARKKNVIRYWIKQNGFTIIGYHKIEELLKQLNSRNDAMSIIEGSSFQIRQYKNELYLVDDSESATLTTSHKIDGSADLIVPANNLKLSRSTVFSYLKREDVGQDVIIRYRETDHTSTAMSHTHRLKRFFQKNQIPPWKRSSIPLLFIDDELIDLLLI